MSISLDYECCGIRTVILFPDLKTAEYSNQRMDASTTALGELIFSGKYT